MKKLALVLMVFFSLTFTQESFAQNVGLIYADGGVGDGIVGFLEGMGMTVTEIDVRSQTPTVEELSAFDVVMVWSNYVFHNPVLMGDNLAAYVDAGGAVVLAQFSFGEGWAIQGGIMADGYSPFSAGTIQYSTDSLGDFDASSPIMDGVSELTDVYLSAVTLKDGATLVASYAGGIPLVAWDFGGRVVGINMYFGVDISATGDYETLIYNALMFASGIQLDGPDLRGDWQSLDRRSFGGREMIRGQLTVSNTGNQGAGRFAVTFYLSDDGVTLDTLIRTRSMVRLDAGQSRRMFFSYSASESLEGRYIIAVIDPAGVIVETNEANNRAVALIN